MKITVTTTTQSLETILWTVAFEALKGDNDRNGWNENRLTILNNWSNTIYIEIWEDATISDWFPVLSEWWIEIPVMKMERVNLISETADSEDIRIINS